MPFNLFAYFQNQGLRVVEIALRDAEGKPSSFILQEDIYRQKVIQPAWESLPPPLRLLLKSRHAEWVDLFLEMRNRVFNLGSGQVELRPDSTANLKELLRRFYPPDPGTGGSGQPAGTSPPVAFPVRPGAVGASVPLAMPVQPTTPGEISAPSTPFNAEESGFEPLEDEPAPPAQANVAVGIDLGTTYSLIAHLDSHGHPVCIPNAQGSLLTPSVVLFEESGTIVGKEAVLASATEPDKVAECVKRDMGAKVYKKPVNGEFLPPEVISSLILRSLKNDAERKLGQPVRQAVITVPAYFEETRRRATMDAGRLAGLEVLDIINEPTAAAIAYGYNLGFLDRTASLPGDKPLRVLVFDLGGGTFDVTIVEILGTSFKALATDGDVCLGGKDWDTQLVELAAERFRHQFREDPRENPCSLQELSLSAENAKRTLSERKKAALHVNHLGSRLKVEVTREEFEEVTAALVERTRMTTEIVVRQAGLTWADIDRVLLVGGSTRMPMIRSMLHDLTGKDPESSINADEAVAHGAALYAELLAPRSAPTDSEGEPTESPLANFTVTNVNSHSLGILASDPESGRKFNKILIPKNSPLPRTVTKTFKTFKPNQRSVAIKVLEGESDRPEVCTQIGVCMIPDLPAELPVGWPVRVSYAYAANGRLHVTARLQGHSAGVTAEFNRENHLPEEELEQWEHTMDNVLKDLLEEDSD